MCSVFKEGNNILKPGRVVIASSARGARSAIWAGFARSEILAWWIKQGAEEVELTATSFAERSENTGQLVWEDIPEGHVISALLDNRKSPPLLKIVTRPANEEEVSRFQHPRMPVIQRRKFEAVRPAHEEPDLFSIVE